MEVQENKMQNADKYLTVNLTTYLELFRLFRNIQDDY